MSETKTCSACKEPQPRTEFYAAKNTKDGLKSWCKPCSRVKNTEWRKANKLTFFKSYIKRMYDLEYDRYLVILKEQNGLCAICGGPPDRDNLCIDHNHKTGAVRGLLCVRCNSGIGNFREDPEKLKSAMEYIWKHNV